MEETVKYLPDLPDGPCTITGDWIPGPGEDLAEIEKGES